jgi:hypothetical protein
MATTLLATLGHQQPEGRETELAALGALAAAPTPAAIWVHGIAGSGKSALLREALLAGGFGSVRRAAETPFNLVLEARG